jgi:hypothetical protein
MATIRQTFDQYVSDVTLQFSKLGGIPLRRARVYVAQSADLVKSEYSKGHLPYVTALYINSIYIGSRR